MFKKAHAEWTTIRFHYKTRKLNCYKFTNFIPPAYICSLNIEIANENAQANEYKINKSKEEEKKHATTTNNNKNNTNNKKEEKQEDTHKKHRRLQSK